MGEPDAEAVVERVSRYVRARELFAPGIVVVAVSGGQDSVCMLDVLRRLQSDLRIELCVVHLNHMFRGAQAEADAEFVRRLAAEWRLPVEVAAIDVPGYRARHHLAKQVAARYARYQFLVRESARRGAHQVAVGHTADDAVETLLMNLLRGTGLAGLGGILPSRRMMPGQLGPRLESRDWRTPEPPPAEAPLPELIRPILELSRAETEAYCLARSLHFRVDPSNTDTAYRRNWIRTRLIPLLERHAPGASQRLRNTSELLADDHVLLNRAVEQLWLEAATLRDDRVQFDLATWQALAASVQRHLVRRAFEKAAGSLEGLGRVHVDAAQMLIRRGQAGARVDLPMGVYLEKGYNSFWVANRATEAAPELSKEPVALPVPGAVVLPVGTIEAELREAVEGEGAAESYRAAGPGEAYLDADRVSSPIEVRRRRPGDRFFPLGMNGPKKLHDFMVDEKVPRGERNRIPIVATREDIMWVAGLRIDERFKVTENTRRVLVLKYRG